MIKLLRNNEIFIQTLKEIRNDLITVSSLLSGLLIAYLTARVLQIRQEKLAKVAILDKRTQNLHRCRSIIDKVLHSNIWPSNINSFIDHDFKDISHFQVRETVFVDSKPNPRVTEFTEDERYSGVASLYLDLKSFVSKKHPYDRTLLSEFEVPLYYSPEIVNNWIKYDSGNGLWYYFKHKYSLYKATFDFTDFYIEDKEDIVKTCLKIDRERYKDLEFGPELLAQLGTQLTEDILPKLHRVQNYMNSDLPKIIKFLFLIAGLVIIFGVALPLLNKVYNISSYIDVISSAAVISISFYLIISFYGFMKRESTIH